MPPWRSAWTSEPYPPELLPNTPRRPSPPQEKRCFDEGQHLVNEEAVPAAGCAAVDILVAAEPRKAIRKRHDDRRHGAGADQPIEALGNVLAVVLPVGMRRPACRVADEIDQQRQAASVVSCRYVNVDAPARRIAEQVSGEALALDPEAVYGAFRNIEILAHSRAPWWLGGA